MLAKWHACILVILVKAKLLKVPPQLVCTMRQRMNDRSSRNMGLTSVHLAVSGQLTVCQLTGSCLFLFVPSTQLTERVQTLWLGSAQRSLKSGACT